MSDLSESDENRSTSNAESSIRVKGDGNQAININHGNAFANVEGNVYINQPPKFLSLHQLPSDTKDFTGRTNEIDTVRQQLLAGQSLVISAVAGMAGVGKSALAIHVAQQLAVSNFPDVQLYVDLRGADGDGLDPNDVLAGFLRAFGLDESVMPRDLKERAAVYRSHLAKKRSIVVLDNAQDEAQVRPLLPGNGGAVIVTSRRVLGALPGAMVLNLKVLSDDEAGDLLAKLVGRERLAAEPEAMGEILRLCDGLPLAILIVGGVLKSKVHWRLADYSQKLADERRRLEHLQLSDLSVRSSFELSYKELAAADQGLFARLGILVGQDFGVELAGVVQGEDDLVLEGLERLVDAQLLEADVAGRFRFHDLLRVFAGEKLAVVAGVEEQEEIRQSVVDWGCEKSSWMADCLRPVERRQMVQEWIKSGEVATDFDEQVLMLFSLAWFEQEREYLLSAVDWANNVERGDAVITLAASLANFFQTRSDWQNWEKTILMALEATNQIGYRHLKSAFATELGNIYCLQGRWDKAIKSYEQSLTIFRELGDRPREGQAILGLGNVYRSKGQFDKAISCYEQSLTICQEFGNQQGESQSLNGLGNVYQFQKRWNKVIDCHEQSLIIKQKLGDTAGECVALVNLGNMYQGQRQWNDAVECYEQSLTISRKLGDQRRENGALANLGNVYQSQDQWDKAIDCYQRSLTICRDFGDRYGEAQTLANFGLVYEQIGQIDLAISLWQEALIKFPEGAAEYPTIQKWLANAQNPP